MSAGVPRVPRDPHEPHRAATPLELFFDLCFVVAIAQAAAGLHHGLVEAHYGAAIVNYVAVFFAIWWAWMNFTWLASAYDTDDVPYRLAVLLQMAGVLVLAAGVPRAVDHRDFTVMTIGFAVMRLGLVWLWIRAARSDAAHRRTAIRYAIGVSMLQAGWLALLAAPANAWIVGFLVLAPAELAVPVWAERAGRTTWHPHHIAERYGLLALIVLGESVLAATVAIQSAFDTQTGLMPLLGIVIGGMLTLFSLWWLYFDHPAARLLESTARPFVWGYGHFAIYAATAAVGAGLAAAVDHAVGRGHMSAIAAGLSIAVPVAVFILTVWGLLCRPLDHPGARAYLVATVLVLASAVSPMPVPSIGVVLSGLVVLSIVRTRARGSGSGASRAAPRSAGEP